MAVSASGYYAWRKRLTLPPKPKRKHLAQLVKDCYLENRRRYGVRRITASLQRRGVRIGKERVRRLMKEEGLQAIGPKKFVPKTTASRGTQAAPNLLQGARRAADAPRQILIGDITYLPLQNGKWCYLAMWQDQVTRRIIGWRVASTMTADLVIAALQKALRTTGGLAGAIIHSDRGSQYAAQDFRALLRRQGLRQSMSGKGNCYDNAQAESFFARFKTELLEGGAFASLEEAEAEIFSYIEGYYNRVRLHSSLGYQSPMEFELAWNLKHGGKKESGLSIFT